MDIGLMGQSFLAETQGFAKGADAFAKRSSGWGEWFSHEAANDIRPDCLCTEKIRPMPLRPDTVAPYVCVSCLDLSRREGVRQAGRFWAV
jgi:hypothetical protein